MKKPIRILIFTISCFHIFIELNASGHQGGSSSDHHGESSPNLYGGIPSNSYGGGSPNLHLGSSPNPYGASSSNPYGGSSSNLYGGFPLNLNLGHNLDVPIIRNILLYDKAVQYSVKITEDHTRKTLLGVELLVPHPIIPDVIYTSKHDYITSLEILEGHRVVAYRAPGGGIIGLRLPKPNAYMYERLEPNDGASFITYRTYNFVMMINPHTRMVTAISLWPENLRSIQFLRANYPRRKVKDFGVPFFVYENSKGGIMGAELDESFIQHPICDDQQ